MKTMGERLKTRMQPDRPMITISLRMPEDVIDDLKEIAPMLGFTGYQPLMRSYIGQGLRKDLTHLEGSQLQALTESLRKHGVLDEHISPPSRRPASKPHSALPELRKPVPQLEPCAWNANRNK